MNRYWSGKTGDELHIGKYASTAQHNRETTDPVGSIVSGNSGTDDDNHSRTNSHESPRECLESKPHRTADSSKGNTRVQLSILEAVNRKAISAVETPEWREIEVTVDSGACDSVMPTSHCMHIPIHPNGNSISGLEYEVANSMTLLNVGESRVKVRTENSETERQMVFQCADVHKPLLSVTKCADQGYECMLNREGGYLEDTVTGEMIPLHRKGDLYVMRVWVKNDSDFVGQR